MEKVYRLIFIFVAAFILNAIWELLHYQLYLDLSGISKYPHLLLATFTDALIITGIFLIVSLGNKSFRSNKKTDYLWVALLGVSAAAFIEFRALRIGRWAYQEMMPTVFGIGLSPLMQLASTGVISLFLARLKFRR